MCEKPLSLQIESAGKQADAARWAADLPIPDYDAWAKKVKALESENQALKADKERLDRIVAFLKSTYTNMGICRKSFWDQLLLEYPELRDDAHYWVCIDPGMYDDLYQCTRCGEQHMESADNISSTCPVSGCKGPVKDLAE